MKKIKIILIILMLISIILTPCDSIAAGMNLDHSICFIDENGYDDGKLDVKHYAPTCSLSSGVKVNYTTSGDKRIGKEINGSATDIDQSMNVQMQIKLSDSRNKIYVGDTLTVTFYFIDDATYLNLSTARVGDKEIEYKNEKYYVKLEETKNEDGKPHLKVTAKITFLSKGNMDVPIKLILKNHTDANKCNALVNIKIPFVYSKEDDVANILTGKGYKLVTGIENSYGSVSRAKAWMRKQGIISEEKINSSGINFKKYVLDENKEINGLTNGKITFNNISFNQDKTVSAWQVSGYNDGNASMAWSNYKMKAGRKYTVTYDFVYFDNHSALFYKLVIDKAGETTNSDGNNDVNGRLNEDLEGVVEETEKAKKRILSIIPQDEQRNTVVFKDVIEDINYYTNVGDIDSGSAGKLEGKISTVITVITNIGIIFSVLMPAVIGIKYMLGSVEEKAEYKKDMIPYLVGAGLLFGVCTLVKILQTIGNSINSI